MFDSVDKGISNESTSEGSTGRNSHSSDSVFAQTPGVKYINYGEEDQMVIGKCLELNFRI